jgi:hypothetical protein
VNDVIAIVGPRNFSDWSFVRRTLDTVLAGREFKALISGGARGVDTLAERYAREVLGLPWESLVSGLPTVRQAIDRPFANFVAIAPNYHLPGHVAPLRRNDEVVKLCTELHALVPPGWAGRGGTRYTIDRACKLGRQVFLHQEGSG